MNKLTKWFYCICKECVYKRFPYFSADFFSCSGVKLAPSHKTLIKPCSDERQNGFMLFKTKTK